MRFLGSTRSLWDRDRQTGPATPWHSVCSWKGTSHAQHTLGRDAPNPAGRGKVTPNPARKGREMPALKLPPVAPLLAWGGRSRRWISHPKNCRNRFNVSHSLPTPWKAAGIAKARDAVPMLRRHLRKGNLCPFPASAREGHCHLWEALLGQNLGDSSWPSLCKINLRGSKEGHPSAVCVWMGTSPSALQASSPSCCCSQPGATCAQLPERFKRGGNEGGRDPHPGMAPIQAAQGCSHPAQGSRKEGSACAFPGAGRAAGAEQTACRSFLLPPTPPGNTAEPPLLGNVAGAQPHGPKAWCFGA